MTRATLLAAAVAALAPAFACSNLPDIASGVCGNGVVDPGEDCDGDASAAGGTCGTTGPNACHFVCANSAACPTGYVCASDQRCRAPSATFSKAAGPYPFDGDDVATGDVDGDGTDDLVGVSSDTLTARFGNADGDLGTVSSQPISTPVTHAVFGDLDGKGGMDVMVPNSVGVFSFLASGQGFNPYPYTSLSIGDQTSPVEAADVEVVPDAFSEILAMVGKDMAFINTQAQYTVCIDGGTPPDCVASLHDVSDLLPGPLPTGRTGYEFGAAVPPEQDFTDEFVLAFKNADHVDLWSSTLPTINADGSVDETTMSVVKIETLQLPKAGTLNTQIRVADDGTAAFGKFDLDDCTDLMIPVSQVDATGKFEALAIAYGSKVGGVCTGKLDPPILVAEAELDPDGTTKGLIPRVIADLDGDGISDVVTNELIAVTSCTRDQTGCKNGVDNAFALDFRGFTPRTWTAALATDVNRDGITDLAGIVAGQDDVDVMIGAGAGLTNRFQISTALPTRFLRTGDFDGDLFLDVAVVTGDTTDPDEDDDLVVLYGGASGGPSTPIDMGDFGVVEDLAPVSLFTDIQHIDAITDLLVIADRGTRRGVAPLIGSSTRRLLAPYLLSEGNGATDVLHDTPVAIQIGQYDGDAAGKLDLCALAHLVPQETPTGGTGTGLVDLTPRIFMLVGQGDGDLAGGPPLIPGAEIPDFEYRDATFASGRLAPANPTDTIVGIDATDDKRNEVQAQSPHLFTATPTTTGTWELSTPIELPAPYNAIRVHSVELVDLDADGLPDLLVRMVSGNPKSANEVVNQTTAIVLWNKDGALDAANPTPVFPASAQCHGAAAIQADTDPALEIASTCVDGSGGMQLTIFHWDGGAWSQVTQPFGETGDEPTPVVGDFNGDGLADLAITTGTGATATVQVYLQCALGDVACTTRTNDQPSSGM